MGMLLVTMLVMLLVVGGMSVGVMFGRKPISGSCGGVGRALNEKDYVCDYCGNDESKCEERNARSTSGVHSELAYEASTRGPGEGVGR